MRDRPEQIWYGASVVLVILLCLSLLRAGCRAGALFGAKIPPVPTLQTNSVAPTNAPPKNADAPPSKMAGTNGVKNSLTSTNGSLDKTNKMISTNSLVATTNLPGTDGIKVVLGTNPVAVKTNSARGANALVLAPTNSTFPNQAEKKSRRSFPPGMMPGGFPGMPGMPGGGAPASLPAVIQARVDKIVDSEMFAPVMRPQPMALLGIAGETVFLRTASGQTGLLKADEPLDGVKLLRIGINRVLVEVGGQKKELMIFDGYGGESLMTNDISQ